MRRAWILRIGIGLALLPGASVRAEGPADRWQPPSPEELALHDSAIEPGADAEALSFDAWVDDHFDSYLESQRVYAIRLKIYTNAGAQKYSSIDIDYPLSDVRLTDVRARVVQA
ncbi:MAG TPA: hypothetical protein VMI75_28125, partial [Polyangiaceae bacterium]|nr:hypothetical protein [Polyangiaceae bacterium]